MKGIIFFVAATLAVLLLARPTLSYTINISVNTQPSDTGRQLAKTCDCGTSQTCECTVTCYHNAYCSCTPGVTNYGKIETWNGTILLSNSSWAKLYTAVSTNPCIPYLNYSVTGTVGGSYQYDCSIDAFNVTDASAANWSVVPGSIFRICFYVNNTSPVSYYIRRTPTGPNNYTGTIAPTATGWACKNVNLPWDYRTMVLGRTSGLIGYSTVDVGTGNSIFYNLRQSNYDRWHAVCMGIGACGPYSRPIYLQKGWNPLMGPNYISTRDFFVCETNCPDGCSGLAIAYWDALKSRWYAVPELNDTVKNIEYWIYAPYACSFSVFEY